MKIAIIHYTKPPTIGGVERVVSLQELQLKMLGHMVDIFTAKTLPKSLSSYDTVIVHNVFTMPFNLALTRRLHELAAGWKKGKWINWVHDVAAINPHYAHLPWEDKKHQILKKPPPNCIHVAVSELRRAEYANMTGLPLKNVRIIPNSVFALDVLGTDIYLAARMDLDSLWKKDFIFIHPTRIVRRKNLEMALRIVAAVRDLGYSVAYLVTGAPDPHNPDYHAYFAELKKQISRLKLKSSCHFLGEEMDLHHQQVYSLLRLSDALLFPSTSEGFGLPLLEAAVAGLPVYCSDIPAHREVATQDARFFGLDEDPAVIAKRIVNDNQLQLHRRRREVYAKYDFETVAHRHLPRLLRDAVRQ